MSVIYDFSDIFFSSLVHHMVNPIVIGGGGVVGLLYQMTHPGEKRSDIRWSTSIVAIVILFSIVMLSWTTYVFVLHRMWLAGGKYLSVTGVVEDFVYSVKRTNGAQKFSVNGVGFFYVPMEHGICGPTSPDSVKSGMLVKIDYRNDCILRIEQIE